MSINGEITLSKLEGGREKRNAIFPHMIKDLLYRSTRMNVHRDIQFLYHCPKWVVFRLIVEEHFGSIFSLLEIIQHDTVKSKLLNGAFEFLSSLMRIMHGKGSESTES